MFLSTAIYVVQFSGSVYAQATKSGYYDIGFSFLQIKDFYNYGLAHTGGNLSFGISKEKILGDKFISWQSNLAFGAMYNKGIGLNFHISPFQYKRGYKISKSNNTFLGGYLGSHFLYQVYPELQNGQMFWLSSQEVGAFLQSNLAISDRIFKVQISNSLLSLYSRPHYKTEEYFYSIKFKDFINNPLSNLSLGSLNSYAHTNIMIETGLGKKNKISYRANYFWAADASFKYLTHELVLKIKMHNYGKN